MLSEIKHHSFIMFNMKTNIFILELYNCGKLLVFSKTHFKWVLNDSKDYINVKIRG